MPGRNLSWRAVYYMLAQLAANAVGAVTSMVLARLFSKQEMGDYQQLMMLYGIFSGILIAGLPSCLTYFYPITEDAKKPATVYIVLAGLFVSGMLIGVATYWTAPFIGGYFRNVRLGPLARNFFLFYAFTLGGSYMRRFLVVVNRYRFMMFWLPFDRVLMMLSFALPALLGMGLEKAVLIAVWVAGAKFVITTVYTMMLVPPTKFVWDTVLAAKMFWYSLPLGLSQGVSQISRQIDRLVIGRFMSTEFFATFTWAAMALPFVPEISESVMTVLTPEFARLHKDGDNAQFLSIWHESIRKTSIIILGVFGLVEALAEPIIIALYSAKYADSVPYFRLYQIGLLVRVTVFGAILQSLGETRQILYASIFMLAVKALTSVALFKLLGPVGPVIASLVLTGLLSVYFLFFISRRLGTNLRRVWPWLSYAKILVAAVLAGAAALAVYAIPKESIASALAAVSLWLSTKPSVISAVQLAIGSAIFTLVYVLVLHATGSLKAKDWQLLKAMTYGRFVGK